MTTTPPVPPTDPEQNGIPQGVPGQPPLQGAPQYQQPQYQQGQYQQPQYQAPQPMTPSDERLWSMLIHLGAIVLGFWPAVIGYLIFKDRGPFIRAHAMTALNFQITIFIAMIAGAILSIIVIGFFIMIAVSIVVIVFSIIAGLAANRGQFYKYPLTIEFVK